MKEEKPRRTRSRIKIFCHGCDGKKTIDEKTYPKGKIIPVVCPECIGDGYVYAQYEHEGEAVELIELDEEGA